MAQIWTAVLSNPGAETGDSSGMVYVFGAQLASDSSDLYSPNSGSFMFGFGSGAYGYAYKHQSIPESLGVASGNVFLKAGVYVSDYATASDRDDGRISFEVLDANSNTLLLEVTSTTAGSADHTWYQREVDLHLPPGATDLIWHVAGVRSTGTVLNFNWDDFYLEGHNSADIYRHDCRPKNAEFRTGNLQGWMNSADFGWGDYWQVYSFQRNPADWFSPIRHVAYLSSYGAPTTVYQIVNVVNSGNTFYSDYIDAGSANFVWRYTQGSFSEGDNSLLGVEFLSGSETVLASISHVASPFVAPQEYLTYGGSLMAPVGTRKIRYNMTMVRSAGNNADGYVTGINGYFTTASPIVAVETAHLSSSLSFAVVFENTKTTSDFFTLPHSSDIPGPANSHLLFMTEVVTPGYGVNDKSWSIGVINNRRSTVNSREHESTYMLNYAQDNTTAAFRYGVAVEAYGPGIVTSYNVPTVYRIWGINNDSGYLAAKNVSDSFIFPKSHAVGGLSFEGFMSTETDLVTHTTLVGNDGASYYSHVGFTPHLLFLMHHTDNNTTALSQRAAPAIGFIDMRSPGHGNNARIMSAYEWINTDSGSYPIKIFRNEPIFTRVDIANPDNDYAFYNARITSAAYGITVTVESIYSQASNSQNNCMYQAYRFDHPGAHWRVSDFSLNGSWGVSSVQCNSLRPEMLLMFSTLQYSFDTPQTSGQFFLRNAYEGACFTFGCVGGSNKDVAGFSDSSLNSWAISDHATTIQTGYILAYQFNGLGQFFKIGNFGMFSGGFSYNQVYSYTGISSMAGIKINFAAVGYAVDAPAHFQGEDGESVFLTNQEYGDDLLLSGAAASSGGGGSGVYTLYNREFWTDAAREFPTRINTIRDFPIF